MKVKNGYNNITNVDYFVINASLYKTKILLLLKYIKIQNKMVIYL